MAEEIRILKDFIEKEVPKAPPLYVSVFLMTKAAEGKTSAAEIAEKLEILESDVLKAWRYWEERDCFAKEAAQMSQSKAIPSERPQYSPAELSCYLKREDVKRLFQSAQQKLGKTLSSGDMATLFSFYDWLGLPLEVIDLLLTYCVSRGKRGMHYIEKVAMGWAEEGLDSLEAVEEYLQMRKEGYGAIMRAFGQGKRLPAPEEETYMKKWLREYKLPLDVVVTACERTIMRTGGVSFAYADKILREWHQAGVKSQADIAKLDEAFAAKRAQQKASEQPRQTAPQRQNRFINYTQREWDYNELERLEREKQREW